MKQVNVRRGTTAAIHLHYSPNQLDPNSPARGFGLSHVVIAAARQAQSPGPQRQSRTTSAGVFAVVATVRCFAFGKLVNTKLQPGSVLFFLGGGGGAEQNCFATRPTHRALNEMANFPKLRPHFEGFEWRLLLSSTTCDTDKLPVSGTWTIACLTTKCPTAFGISVGGLVFTDCDKDQLDLRCVVFRTIFQQKLHEESDVPGQSSPCHHRASMRWDEHRPRAQIWGHFYNTFALKMKLTTLRISELIENYPGSHKTSQDPLRLCYKWTPRAVQTWSKSSRTQSSSGVRDTQTSTISGGRSISFRFSRFYRREMLGAIHPACIHSKLQIPAKQTQESLRALCEQLLICRAKRASPTCSIAARLRDNESRLLLFPAVWMYFWSQNSFPCLPQCVCRSDWCSRLDHSRGTRNEQCPVSPSWTFPEAMLQHVPVFSRRRNTRIWNYIFLCGQYHR